jgi:hypothetical protein
MSALLPEAVLTWASRHVADVPIGDIVGWNVDPQSFCWPAGLGRCILFRDLLGKLEMLRVECPKCAWAARVYPPHRFWFRVEWCRGPDPKPYNAAAHRTLTFERGMASAIEEPGELEKHG